MSYANILDDQKNIKWGTIIAKNKFIVNKQCNKDEKPIPNICTGGKKCGLFHTGNYIGLCKNNECVLKGNDNILKLEQPATIKYTTTIIDENYQIMEDDCIIHVINDSNVTLPLITNNNQGKLIKIINKSNGNIEIYTLDDDKINGNDDYTLRKNHIIEIINDSYVWFVSCDHKIS